MIVLTVKNIIESEFLESRFSLLEIAAMLDRCQFAIEREGEVLGTSDKVDYLREATALIAQPDHSTNCTEQLLHIFATV